jgi:hypothetical protein
VSNILAVVPGVSYGMIKRSKVFNSEDDVQLIEPFKVNPPYNLEVSLDIMFDTEDTWVINLPYTPLEANGLNGIAGPGKGPELFVPAALKKELKLGTYDKYRPYPAEEFNEYTRKMALKFTKKRIKAFEKIAKNKPWRRLIYFEHSAASVAHLNEEVAIQIVEKIFTSIKKLEHELPSSNFIMMSPYGHDSSEGFVTSNRITPSRIRSWEQIRSYLRGRGKNSKSTA